MRLIDADTLRDRLKEIVYDRFNLSDMTDAVAEAPTIDPVKHGLWYRTPELTDIGEYIDRDTWKCTVCGSEWAFIEGTPEDNGFKYCPECGAKMKMDGEEHETD